MCSTVFRCEPCGGAPGERAQSLQESSSGDSGLLKVKEDDRSDVKVVVTFPIQWFASGC